MRHLRIVIFLLFVISVCLFGFFEYNKYANADKTLPVIEGSSEVLELKCVHTKEELMKGLAAYDEDEGDLTDEIIAGNFSPFYEKGKCNITYAVFDKSNHPATFTRKVEFIDYHSPRIELTEPLVFKVNSIVKFYDYLVAEDIFDGDISREIRITDSDVDFTTAGRYAVKAELINSFGDVVEIILPVHVLDNINTAVEIQLKKNIVYLQKNEKFKPSSMIEKAETAKGAEISLKDIKIDSNVDTSDSGTYEVKYSYITENNTECSSWLTVIVE